MNFAIIIPFLIGTSVILQGGLNKNLSSEIGINHTVFWTNLVCISLSIFLFIFAKFGGPHVPNILQIKAPLTTFKWWYVLPGLFGFAIVAGLPLAIYKLGAVKVTVGLIAAQMIVSVLWDIYVEKIPVNTPKVWGMIMAAASVGLITFS